MPTYDYVCDSCNHSFDEFQSMNDKPLKKCPKCGKQKLRRLFGTGSAVLFKGSGFYSTDYRSSDYKAAAQADQAPADTGKTDTSTPSPAPTDSGNSGKKAK